MTSNDITAERARELIAEYEVLKERMRYVDRKYSVTYNEVVIDMPETLGLQYLTFTPKTEEEIRQIATRKAQDKFASRNVYADKGFAAACANLEYRRAAAEEKYRKQCESLNQSDDTALCNKMINNGLLHSSIYPEARDEFSAKREDARIEYGAQKRATLQALDDKLAAVTQAYNEQKANIAQGEQNAVEIFVASISDKQEKERIAVEKYNAQVDEKETRYQYSRQRALEIARHNEHQRSFQAAKLYAQLGERGVELQKCTEKYWLARSAFASYYRCEAQLVMGLDSFLQANLGSYYSALQDWVNTTLPA